MTPGQAKPKQIPPKPAIDGRWMRIAVCPNCGALVYKGKDAPQHTCTCKQDKEWQQGTKLPEFVVHCRGL